MASKDPQVAFWVASNYAVSEKVIAALISNLTGVEPVLVTMLSTHPQAPLVQMRLARMHEFADIGLHAFATRQGVVLDSPQGERIFAVIDQNRVSEQRLGVIWDCALRDAARESDGHEGLNSDTY